MHIVSTDSGESTKSDTSSSNQSRIVVKEKALGPLREERIPVLRQRYDEFRASARRAERIVDEIVESYSDDLDKYVDKISAWLDEVRDEKKEFSDKTLQYMAMRLPVLMYRMSDMISRAGLESDITKAATKLMRQQAYLGNSEGTIPEREAQTDLQLAEETVIVDLTKHVYTRLRGKVDHANAIFDGVRKVMSSRDNEKQTFRGDK